MKEAYTREPISQKIGLAIQFCIALAIGCYVYVYIIADGDSRETATYGALLCGFFGLKAVMFIYVWLRFGWAAARSMRML